MLSCDSFIIKYLVIVTFVLRLQFVIESVTKIVPTILSNLVNKRLVTHYGFEPQSREPKSPILASWTNVQFNFKNNIITAYED